MFGVVMCTRWVIARSFDERVSNNSIGGGDDVHGPTTAFQRRCALATDTPPPMAVTILWSVTPWLATRALVLQAIEELARTSRTSTELPDLNVGFKVKLQYGGVPKTRRRAAELARALASK
jgi:hypothetical protein